jgi:signal peptidase I
MHFDFPTFLVIACAVTGIIWLIDVWFFAKRRRERARYAGAVKEPILVEYSRSFFPVILIVLLLRSFLFEPFRIPSGSMMPTLLVGDFILVNKYEYGIRLPVINEKVIEIGGPQRGDVVVFRYPQNPRIDYIKRIVGLPGDRIGYQNKLVYVNGQPAPQQPDGVYQGEGSGARETGSLRLLETLGEVRHSILINTHAPNLAPGCQVLWEREIQVPEGHYFVMGDNRDNSNDSRCWGLVPDKNLVGRAVGIWMNWDTEHRGFPVAWGRIGTSIH